MTLVMDSGGGARLHVSAAFAMVCLKYNIRPFYLYANTTRAFMLLDQDPNREAERVWNQARRANSAHGLNTVKALHVARHVWEQAYTASRIQRGAERVGIKLNEKFDRSEITVARADELFKSLGSAEVAYA